MTTVWKACVKCGKQFFYDSRVLKCATCCRIAKQKVEELKK